MCFNFLILHFELAILTCTVLATDPPGVYKVLTTNLAQPLPPGTVFRVNTGGPIPPGADAVIMVEDTVIKSTDKDREGGDLEEAEIETLAQIPKGENVRLPGSDVNAGDLVLPKDTILGGLGGDIGTLAFVGKQEVRVPRFAHRVHLHAHPVPQVHVFRKPIVAVLSTGNEIVDLHDDQKTSGESWGGIWDTNRPSLQTALESLGYRVLDLGIAHDKFVLDRFAKNPSALLTWFSIVQRPRSRLEDPTGSRCCGSDFDDRWDIHGSR